MKKYLKFGVFSFVVLVSIFFSRKAEYNKLQNVILLNNVEALAADESPMVTCIGSGSVDRICFRTIYLGLVSFCY